jgi:hypothetical protein
MHPTVTIENMSWSTVVPIYKTITVTKEGWELPAGAKLISAEKKAYQERRKMFHYSGEIIYNDWYTYQIEEQTQVRSATAHGTKSNEITVPNPTLNDGENAGGAKKTFTITTNSGDTYLIHESDYKNFNVGDTVKISINDNKSAKIQALRGLAIIAVIFSSLYYALFKMSIRHF